MNFAFTGEERRALHAWNWHHMDKGVQYVYFISCGEFVKIGSTQNIKNRLREFEVGNPYRLDLLALVPGTMDLEYSLHGKFYSKWYRGEWFHLGGPVAKFIRTNNDVLANSSSTPDEVLKWYTLNAVYLKSRLWKASEKFWYLKHLGNEPGEVFEDAKV